MKCDRHCIAVICTKPTKLDFSAQNPHIILLSEAIHCKMFAIHNQVITDEGSSQGQQDPRQSHDFVLFSGSLDPSGLLDIASFICICSRVFSVVKVRQSEGEQGNPLLPRGYEQRLQFGSNFLSFALQRERSCHARLPAFTFLSPLSPHTFPWRSTHFVSSQMNVSLKLLWHLSELQLYYRFQLCGDSWNGTYRGICCITEQICSDYHVYTTFL